MVSSWRLIEEGHSAGLLLSAWGNSFEDVWLVGGRRGKTAILAQNDQGFEELVNPGEQLAWWVCGLGDQRLVVGERGLALLRLQRSWETLDLGTEATLFGCWGRGVEDFWVVGGDPIAGPALLLHVVDRVPKAIEPLARSELAPPTWFKVWGNSDTIWVVGEDGGTLIHPLGSHDEEDWTFERIANGNPLFTVVGSEDGTAWAVGGRARAVVAHFDGRSWSATSPADAPGFLGVALGPEGAVTAVGESSVIYELNVADLDGGHGWQETTNFATGSLHAVWSDEVGNQVAVGGNIAEPDSERWRGSIAVRRR